MPSDDLQELSALDQAALIRSRRVSSEELVRLYLARIERLNAHVGAFVEVFAASAMADARRCDESVRRGEALGPFHGVPIGIKDLNMVRRRWTRFGSHAVKFWSPVDCKSTASLRRGGFIIAGKLATSELGAMPVTEPDTHAPARNPWDLDVTPGGSSGGSAAAVAAGLLPVAHGSDGGGSIRIPASLCNLYGIKASRGRVPNAFGFADHDLLYTCGPLTRTVADAAAILDVMAGLDIGRPHWLAPPQDRFTALMHRAPGKLRIGLVLTSDLVDTHPSIAQAITRVAKVLEGLGHHVEEAREPKGSVEEFLPVYQKMVGSIPVFNAKRLQPVTRWLWEAGRGLDTKTTIAIMRGLATRVLAGMDGFDLWLTPTVGIPTPRIGEWKDDPPAEAFAKAARLGVFTAPANISGQPAASVPAGFLDGRWPIGAHLVGRPGSEGTILAVSRQLEEAMPWAARWPELAR